MSELLYLSEADIAGLHLRPAVVRAALARAFRLHAEGRTRVQPKLTVAVGPGHFFQSLCAAAPELSYAANKWVGVAAENAARGLANVNGVVILSDVETGVPVAILDGNSLTVLRTAAMSALVAQHLARTDSTSISFVGCGAQAHGHLEALRDVLPSLQEVVCCSRSDSSAERLAAVARTLGLEARVARSATEALVCDVVVTSVPASTALRPFLHAGELRPGCFVCAVDLGRSWQEEGLRALDILVTDDHAQAADPANRAKLGYPGPFDADLAALVSGTHPGRTDRLQRAMFLFPGFALADLAIAAQLYAAAVEAGRGARLTR
ncbi:MAG: ornithine cyclodeaminase family protein [Pseudomonadota bacterium]|nr:ornithine cyclodeaminase family protein [Pseudomonadota bacterium]